MAFKAPLAAEPALQVLGGAAGLAVGAVVRAHDGLHLGFLHQGLEGGQIGFLHVLFGGHGVKLVAEGFRPGMDGEMLGAGGGFEAVPVPLQALGVGYAHPGGQVRVLPEGLLAAAPAGIAENVDVRAPEGEALVNIPVAVGGGGVVLGAALGGGDAAQLFDQLVVKGCAQADGLGEHRRRAGAGHPVQGFVPPVILRHVQPRDRRGIVNQLGRRFLQGHAADQGFRLLSCCFAVHRLHSSYPPCFRAICRTKIRFRIEYTIFAPGRQPKGPLSASDGEQGE